MDSVTSERSDIDALLALNPDYINSVQNGGVRRFGETSAGDFPCSNPDGSFVDREGFPAQTARPVLIRGLVADDVTLRVLGDIAIVHGRTICATAEGGPPNGRYTDARARRSGTGLAASAHVTR